MFNLNNIKLTCKKYNIIPSKSRGQSFLIDQNVTKKIIESADLKTSDTVLEIGPGFGALTGQLIQKVKKVIAIELDKKILDFLKENFSHEKNLTIVSGDALKINPQKLNLKKFEYKVVANLPYSITSNFLRQFIEMEDKPKEMILMIQKEVATRIMTSPGDMSILSVAVQFYTDPKVLFGVNKNCFWPKPQVDSAVIYLNLAKKLPKIDQKFFFQIVKIGFSAKRKQLQNNLSSGFHKDNNDIKKILKNLGFDEKIRAQDLNVSDWVKLANYLKLQGY